MKNYKVEATMKFTDKEESTQRNVGDIFETTKTRYEFLKKNNAVKLIEIIEEKEKVADDLSIDPYKDFEFQEKKSKKKKNKKISKK